MVPQQGDLGRSDSPSSSGIPMFGSQLVDKNSSTPYSDATQVRILLEKNNFNFFNPPELGYVNRVIGYVESKLLVLIVKFIG